MTPYNLMMNEKSAYYSAYAARDPRFDGVFFMGVTSTRIYCRPVCPAKTPKQANCYFFDSSEAAEKAGYRPCLRCRPELAPGSAPIDDAQRIAHAIVQRIEEGLIDNDAGLESIAAQFELSSRQIRRITLKEMGVSPIDLVKARRLLLAKQLLMETQLPITQIAFASGFASLRRFNDVFSQHYKMPPSQLRKHQVERSARVNATDTSEVQLSYRPPYDWEGILDFLAARTLKSAEWVNQDGYYRTVRLGRHEGWVAVRHAKRKRTLIVEFTHSLMPVLPVLLGRLRHLFDLSARPDLVVAHLSQDPVLKGMVKKNPGLRVPGAFDGFEQSTRAVLGQQVTVKVATTLTYRLVEAFGESIETPFTQLSRLAPSPQRMARATLGSVAKLGIVGVSAKSIIALAEAYMAKKIQLDAGAHPEKTFKALVEIPGIGPWTAQYIAMRALRWPDAFPKEDVAVRNNLGGVSAKRAEEMSQAWRPWRSYAVLHIWRSLWRIQARSATLGRLS